MNPIPPRMVIFSKDVRNIIGLTERTAQRLLHRIRQAYGKPPGSYVSIDEFCQYTGLQREAVALYLV